MNLRDHGEVAALLSRLTLTTSQRPFDSFQSQSRFWNHVGYLEHLWSKELDFSSHQRLSHFNQIQVKIEILVTQLLIQTTAAGFHVANRVSRTGPIQNETLLSWEKHSALAKTLLEKGDQTDVDPSTLLRLERLRSRLEHWGDFLLSSGPELARFASDNQRYQEFREKHPGEQEASWSLFTAGITHAVPARSVRDTSRSAVHRLLQNLAVSQISSHLFLKDGRPKPRIMRWIESGPVVC